MSCSEEPRKPLGAGETTSTQLLLLLETRITFVAISLWHGRSSRPPASGLDHFRNHVEALGRYDDGDVDDFDDFDDVSAAAADTRSPQKRINSHSRTFFFSHFPKKTRPRFFLPRPSPDRPLQQIHFLAFYVFSAITLHLWKEFSSGCSA